MQKWKCPKTPVGSDGARGTAISESRDYKTRPAGDDREELEL